MTNNNGLDQRAIDFIKENKVAQQILQHLHPDEDTIIVVEGKNTKCPFVGIVYGAKRIWLNPTRESKEPFDVITKLYNLSILQENLFDGNSYFALKGEWNYSKDSTIYTQISPKPELRREWHKASDLKVTPVYLSEK